MKVHSDMQRSSFYWKFIKCSAITRTLLCFMFGRCSLKNTSSKSLYHNLVRNIPNSMLGYLYLSISVFTWIYVSSPHNILTYNEMGIWITSWFSTFLCDLFHEMYPVLYTFISNDKFLWKYWYSTTYTRSGKTSY